MSLFSITYTSVRVGDLVVNDMVDLAERASAYNAVSGVTGFLCHIDGHYLQTIEGEYEEVNRIYHQRIAPAQSHRDLRLIHLESASQRRFGQWNMGFANVTASQDARLKRYLPTGMVHPERIVGVAALELLQSLSTSNETLTLL